MGTICVLLAFVIDAIATEIGRSLEVKSIKLNYVYR